MAEKKLRARPGRAPLDFGEYADWNRDVILWVIEQGGDPVDVVMTACGAAAGVARNFIRDPDAYDLNELRDALTLTTEAINECLERAARRSPARRKAGAAKSVQTTTATRRKQPKGAKPKRVKPEALKPQPS